MYLAVCSPGLTPDINAPDIFVGREQQLQTLLDSIQQAGSIVTITEHSPPKAAPTTPHWHDNGRSVH